MFVAVRRPSRLYGIPSGSEFVALQSGSPHYNTVNLHVPNLINRLHVCKPGSQQKKKNGTESAGAGASEFGCNPNSVQFQLHNTIAFKGETFMDSAVLSLINRVHILQTRSVYLRWQQRENDDRSKHTAY